MTILNHFPVIDPSATGENILRMRKERGLTVRDLQKYFGFEEPRAIYKWQQGQSVPSVDNLYALSTLFGVPMNDILVSTNNNILCKKQQAVACCSLFVYPGTVGMTEFPGCLDPFLPQRIQLYLSKGAGLEGQSESALATFLK